MLTRIKVNNYKGFKEAEIPIKPITVFLGANSSGKSSILQLLLLLQQTAEEMSDSYRSALKIYGNRISVGDPENLFYCLDCTVPIRIQIDFKNKWLCLKMQKAIEGFLDYILPLSFIINESGKRERKFLSREELEELLKREIGHQEKIRAVWSLRTEFISYHDVFTKNIESLLRNYDFLLALKNKIKDETFSFKYTISYDGANKNLAILDFTLQQDDVTILSYESKNGFSSEIIKFNEDDLKCLKKSYQTSTIFNLFKFADRDDSDNTSLGKSMLNIVIKALSELQSEFKDSQINHVSPLRAHPQRYYMLDKANVTYTLDTYDANAIAEVIKDVEPLKNKVNNWFNQFGIEVDIDEFKEVIHKIKVIQHGVKLDIPDVGFGISQVLPVILQGFLSPSKSVTIVEQPEVHLHPKMQAALADLFIDITAESNFTKSLIIETHSEYLLGRLRRRMAEREKITNDKVSINLFHTRNEGIPATIENLPIEERGSFEWPEELYGGELLEDTTVFLKKQSNGGLYINN
ncbi:MAG: AAA family ATPase [Bacteroidales bacterium]|nr:AAA family ATPase [Bacteroidales bacterium]